MAEIVQAGGIVFMNGGVVLRRTSKGEWVFPKGNLEEGESLVDAAMREVREETGLRGRVLFKAGEIGYQLHEQNYHVHFFAMEGDSTPDWKAHEGVDAFLFPSQEALGKVSFGDSKILLERTLAKVKGGT